MNTLCKFIIFFFSTLILQSQNINFEIKLKKNNEKLNTKSFNSNLIEIDSNLPELYNYIKKNYKGIKSCDSIKFYFNTQNDFQFLIDLSKRGLYDRNNIEEFCKRIDVDINVFSRNELNQSIIFAVLFNGNSVECLGDFNRNQDFADEISSKNQYYSYEMFDFINSKKHSYTRNVSLIKESYDSTFLINNKTLKSYYKLKFNDIWLVDISEKYPNYNFYIQGNDLFSGDFFIYNKSIDLGNDLVYDKQFKFRVFDTLKIENDFFKIDSINEKSLRIYLKEIPKQFKKVGINVDDYILNYILKNLFDNTFFETKNIQIQKKYTLFDFWGTWCGPCLKKTDEIKKIYEKHKNKLNIIGVANDEKDETVIAYIQKKQIDWLNTRVYWKDNRKILSDLKINQYPTYILIDSNGKIIYRGSSLNEVQKFLN
jgi:thiol-disulfide isomerase/thioredoxin